jgi:hypothetical protein
MIVTEFSFKIVDTEGHIHRLKSSIESLDILKSNIWTKLASTSTSSYTPGTHDILLKYTDDEKDEIIISSDTALRDAVEFARNTGLSNLKLDIKFVLMKHTSSVSSQQLKDGQKQSADTAETLLGASSNSISHASEASTQQLHMMIGGAAVAVTALAIIGFVLVRRK